MSKKHNRHHRRHQRSRRRERHAVLPRPLAQVELSNKWATDRDPPRGTCLIMDDEHGVVDTRDSLETTLALAGDQAGEQWVWCLHCERFFQAKHLQLDFLGKWAQCPFEDCHAAGLDIDIWPWDACQRDDPEWPASVDELSHGMRFPPRLMN